MGVKQHSATWAQTHISIFLFLSRRLLYRPAALLGTDRVFSNLESTFTFRAWSSQRNHGDDHDHHSRRKHRDDNNFVKPGNDFVKFANINFNDDNWWLNFGGDSSWWLNLNGDNIRPTDRDSNRMPRSQPDEPWTRCRRSNWLSHRRCSHRFGPSLLLIQTETGAEV